MKYFNSIKNSLITIGQLQYYNGNLCMPSEEELILDGYELLSEYEEVVMTNDDIKSNRQEQYKLRSDSLYMTYQKYLALGQLEKAEVSRLAWLNEIELIDNENPYTIQII